MSAGFSPQDILWLPDVNLLSDLGLAIKEFWRHIPWKPRRSFPLNYSIHGGIWAFSDYILCMKNTSMAAWNSWTQNVLRSRIFGDQEGVRSIFFVKKNISQIIVIFQIGFKQIRLLLEITETPRSEKIIAHFLRKSQGPTPPAIRDYCLANDGLHNP